MYPNRRNTAIVVLFSLFFSKLVIGTNPSESEIYTIKSQLSANPDSTVKILLGKLKESKDDSTTAYINYYIGRGYYYLGDYYISLDYLKNANKSQQVAKNRIFRADVLKSMGYAFEQISNYDKALKSYIEALKIEEAGNEPDRLALLFSNIGHVYLQMKNLKMGFEFLTKAENALKERNDNKGLALIYHYMGKYFSEKGDLDKALDYFDKANKLYTLLYDYYEVAYLNLNISNIYLKQKDYGYARKLLDSNLKNVLDRDYQYLVQKNKLLLCRVYLLTGKRQEAETIINEISPNTIKLKREVYLLKLIMDLETESIAKIMDQMDMFLTNIDYLDDQKLNKQVAELQVLYETEKNLETIRNQNELIKKQKLIMIIITISVIVTIVLLVLLHRYHLKLRRTYRSLYEKTKSMPHIVGFRNKPWLKAGSNGSDRIINDLQKRIEKEMDDSKPYLNPELTIDDLAQLCNTNKTYISRAINNKTNDNFNSYINSYRVNEGINIMQNDNQLPLIDVAYKSGFNSKSSFYRAFMKLTGLAPSVYRDFLQNDN